MASDHSPINLSLDITAAAATNRELGFQSAGVDRWHVRCDSTAEGGSNAGSDFRIIARADNGDLLSAAIFCQRSTAKVAILTTTIGEALTVNGGITLLEKSTDPTEPSEGQAVIWMSDGTGLGDDGDVMIAAKAGGATKYTTLFDHSAGTSWPA